MIRHSLRGVALAASAAILVLLSGCASIPNSGQVHEGASITQQNDPLDLDFNPSPPAKGASQDDLLHGFIDAASSPKKGYAIAREYLTPRLASRWNPDESVTVDQGVGRHYTLQAASHWQLSLSPQAVVNAAGDYQEVFSSAPVVLNYAFEKVGSEWRISVAPNGIVLDASTFSAVFGPQTLYFYSPNFAYLVPDERWFPSRASTATRITNALLAGPSKWLDGAVVSAFPPGTQLTVDAVTTSGNQAQLDLSSEASQANTLALQRMQLQLTQSLSSLVTSVQISIEAAPQTIGNLPSDEMPSTSQPIDSHPLVYRDGAFGFLSGTTVASIPGISDKVTPLHPTSAALSANRQYAAVAGTGGISSVRASTDGSTVIDDRPGVIPPAIDNYGYIWTVPATTPSDLRVTGSDGQTRTVKTSWPSATQISSLAVSRDGTRVVALINSSGVWSFVAAGIIRNSDEIPESLGAPTTLSLAAKNPVAAAWVDGLTVAVLSEGPSATSTIEQQQIGGVSTSVAGPASGDFLTGAGGVATYLVLTGTGSLQAPTGAGWQQQADKITALGTQMGLP